MNIFQEDFLKNPFIQAAIGATMLCIMAFLLGICFQFFLLGMKQSYKFIKKYIQE